MTTLPRTALLAALLLATLTALSPAWSAPLDQGFANPPDSARPHTWWHWINGNVTKVGITADLEAMKQIGIGGAQIFNVDLGIPHGPVGFMSPEWRDMVKHAAAEADRLGLELVIHNCAGWSSSGGPWNTPAHAMQMVTVSERRVKGPAHLDEVLAQPPTRNGYYHDIAVLAFHTPEGEGPDMLSLNPKITSSAPDFNPAPMLDGDPNTSSVLRLRDARKPGTIQFELAAPFTVRSLSFLAGGGGGNRIELQLSDDGQEFRPVAAFNVPEPTILRPVLTLTFPPATGRFFRLAVFRGPREAGAVSIAELRLESGYRIRDLGPKAGFVRGGDYTPDRSEIPPSLVIPRAGVADISSSMDAQGHLVWDVPAGDWTILRLGHTPTGKNNHPAPPEGTGLECDKCSREALDAHFAGMVGKVLGDLGPLAGQRGLRGVLIDSYEVDAQNWTPLMREEFAKRRGYDPLPYLPVMTGRVVDSLEVSERFLWDLRRTLADLYADNYYGYFADLVHQHGMQMSAECYGNGNFDDLQCAGRVDIPMSEFWNGGGTDNQCAKGASSGAHVWGKSVVGAESFTSDEPESRWQHDPYSMKALGDLVWTGGVNRFIFHRYAMQPWTGLYPAMTMGPFGVNLERTLTWWEQGQAWMKYIARSQYLLQAGLFVADLCYFQGEGAPVSLPSRGGLQPPPPPGYDYDGCDLAALLTRMTVRDGWIVLPDGMSYRVLVLPERQTMTPVLLRKIREMVQAGATVYGPRPTVSPSLQDFPNCDREVQTLADEMWGDCDGKAVTEHRLGQGAIIWGKPLAQVLKDQRLPPDFEAGGSRVPNVVYIHRAVDGAQCYFVSSQSPIAQTVECTFRAAGKVPELWHPDTGEMERAPVYKEADNRVTVPIHFDPAGSVFVVFRQPAAGADPVVALTRDGTSVFAAARHSDLKLAIRKAVYGVFTPPATDWVDVTKQVTAMVRNGRLTVQATNGLAGDPAANIVKQMRVTYVLDGQPGEKTVDEGETITIPEGAGAGGPGAEPKLEIKRALYGILPAGEPPEPQLSAVDVTAKLAGLVQDNELSVVAGNELAGDPAPFVVKQMRVDYTLGGKDYSTTVGENATLVLPQGTEDVLGAQIPPPPGLSAAADGTVTVVAWEPGVYEGTTAGGKKVRAEVPAVRPPMLVTGPWNVTFPPNWGAPDRATFEKLISWTDSDVPGIKYFSGTATYTRDLDVPAELLAAGNSVQLDLGVVRNFAQVRLNGADLGILWKPPFRLDVTRLLKPGSNALEVRITNLWPNRLIGDELLPADYDLSPGGPIRAWPAWLLEGKPRTSGRVTFTTWSHLAKDSPLLESGLIGPVALRVGKVVTLTQP